MHQIYRKIERGDLSREQLEFWRDWSAGQAGPCASKVHYACIAQLEGLTKPIPHRRRSVGSWEPVELSWRHKSG